MTTLPSRSPEHYVAAVRAHLDEIHASGDRCGEPSPVIAQAMLSRSGASLYRVDENGEFLDMLDAPDGGADVNMVCEYMAPRRVRLKGEIAGYEAAMAAEIKAITDYYAPLIRQRKSALAWMEARYFDVLAAWLRQALQGRKPKDPKSLRVAGLLLRLREVGGGVEVVDKETAVQYARIVCPEAIKEDVLVSRFPKDWEFPETGSGLRRVPAEDRFYVE